MAKAWGQCSPSTWTGLYRPIAFCSKRLLPHQCHWPPAQLEAYAIFHAVAEKWRYYLTLSKCVIHSDHRNLIWLMNHQNKGMIGRWYAALTAFDLDISYVSVASQLVADPLSRLFEDREKGTYVASSNPPAELLEPGKGPARALSSLAHLMFARPPESRYNLHGRRSSIHSFPSGVSTVINVKNRLRTQFQPKAAARSYQNAIRVGASTERGRSSGTDTSVFVIGFDSSPH